MGSHSAGRIAGRDEMMGLSTKCRRGQSARIACESLEGRQLLSMMGGHPGGAYQARARSAFVRSLRSGDGIHAQGVRAGGHYHQLGVMSTSSVGTATVSDPGTAAPPAASTTAPPVASITAATDTSAASTTAATDTPAAGATTATDTSTTTPAPSTPASTGDASGPNNGFGPGLGPVSRVRGNFGGGKVDGGLVAMNGQGMGDLGLFRNVNGSNPGTTGTSSMPSAQAKTDLQKLQTDLQAIEAKSQVTVAELSGFRSDLQAVGKSTGQPTSDVKTATQTLQSDEATILNSGTFTSDQQTQLVNDYAVVLTAQVATQDQATKASTDLQAIITSSGITSADIATLAADRKAIQTDLGTTGASTSTSTTSSPAPNGFVHGALDDLVLDQPGGPMGTGIGGGREMLTMVGTPPSGGTPSTTASTTTASTSS